MAFIAMNKLRVVSRIIILDLALHHQLKLLIIIPRYFLKETSEYGPQRTVF